MYIGCGDFFDLIKLLLQIVVVVQEVVKCFLMILMVGNYEQNMIVDGDYLDGFMLLVVIVIEIVIVIEYELVVDVFVVFFMIGVFVFEWFFIMFVQFDKESDVDWCVFVLYMGIVDDDILLWLMCGYNWIYIDQFEQLVKKYWIDFMIVGDWYEYC